MVGKISANRTEMQIFLQFPEVQPNFCDKVTKISVNLTDMQIYSNEFS